MACNQLTDILRGCDNNLGGIKKFYITAWDNVTVATEAVTGDGILTTITLDPTISPAPVFVEYEFTKNSSSFVEEAQISLENGSTFYQTTTTLIIPRREVAKRNSLALLANGQQDLFIIMQDYNDVYWAQGWKNGANLTAQGEGSGVAKADGSKYSLTFISEEDQQMPTVDSTIISSLL